MADTKTAHRTTTDTPTGTAAGTMRDDEVFYNLVARLNRQSLEKRHDAYLDVDWDSDEMRIDPADPRWELAPGGQVPLADTEWYADQPPEVRARIGLHWVASKMKTGLVFENILKRGLLAFAMDLPNNSPEFRYAYHEVIEEAQHSLMFQEFVNRSGFDPTGLSRTNEWASRIIVSSARWFPELFFFFVLGGEDPIDHVQRSVLKQSDGNMVPILERIMRIHVIEEARHLSFARNYLQRTIPGLGPLRKAVLAVVTPLTLATMAEMMLKPSPDLVKTYEIPRDVVKSAFTKNPAYRRETIAALAKVRNLCEKTGVVNRYSRWIWKALGIWGDEVAA